MKRSFTIIYIYAASVITCNSSHHFVIAALLVTECVIVICYCVSEFDLLTQ